jgi:hypothetical protein
MLIYNEYYLILIVNLILFLKYIQFVMNII